jgi:hypothetical protein
MGGGLRKIRLACAARRQKFTWGYVRLSAGYPIGVFPALYVLVCASDCSKALAFPFITAVASLRAGEAIPLPR